MSLSISASPHITRIKCTYLLLKKDNLPENKLKMRNLVIKPSIEIENKKQHREGEKEKSIISSWHFSSSQFRLADRLMEYGGISYVNKL